MDRNSLKFFRNPCLINVVALLCGLLLLHSQAFAAEDDGGRLHRFLQNDMAFSEKEFKSFKEGKTVTKILKTQTKHEVGVFSIARINVPKDVFLQNYDQKGMNLETASATSWGIIKTPPKIEELKDITLPEKDIKLLKKCKPGNCKVKAPIGAIEKVGQLDAKAPDFEQKVNQFVQEDTVDYVSKYLKNGNKMLVEYGDKKNPVRLAEQFQGLLQASPYLKRHVPEMYAYLDKFPNQQLPEAEDIFIWLKEDFDSKQMRPVMSINHLVFYRPQGSSNNPPIVALKQLYATHYFEASLGLTVMVDDPAGDVNSTYLLNVTRTRIDALRDMSSIFAKQMHSGARKLLDRRMKAVKRNMEKKHGSSAGK